MHGLKGVPRSLFLPQLPKYPGQGIRDEEPTSRAEDGWLKEENVAKIWTAAEMLI